jgi:hypothetical protein
VLLQFGFIFICCLMLVRVSGHLQERVMTPRIQTMIKIYILYHINFNGGL